jgi:O-antigen ligase
MNKDHLSRTIGTGFLIAVVFSALAHGAVEAWSVFVFEIIIIALIVLWCIKVVADKRLKLNVPDVAIPIAALVAVGLVQSIAFTNGAGGWISLSKNVEYTRAAVTVLIFLVISFLIAANFFGTRERLSILSHFLVIYGFGMAMFALIQHYTWNGRFYWIRPTEATSAFGPFANHNHFAGYMEMLVLLPVALVVTRGVRTELRVLYGFAATVMGLAIVLSLSRGGIISMTAGMIFLALVSLRLPRRHHSRAERSHVAQLVSRFAIVVAIIAMIAGGIFWLGADPVINRIKVGQAGAAGRSETFFSSRGWVWRDTITMIKSNPVLGVGLGAYDTAFSMYTKSDGSLRVPQAHNDYLQIVADCGVVGGLIAIWFLIILFRTVMRGIRSRDPLYAGLALGSGSGIFALLVHSLFDFNLQLPANALLFLVLVAIAVYAAAAAKLESRAPGQTLGAKSNRVETEIASSAGIVRGV